MDVVYDTDVYEEAGGLRHMHAGDAGLDLRTTASFTLPAHGFAVADTGVHVQLPPHTFGAIRSRSGLASKHGIFTVEGTVDENFTGKILVTLVNASDHDFHFDAGDRVCQMVVIPYVSIETRAVRDLKPNAARGDAGYGSTGLE